MFYTFVNEAGKKLSKESMGHVQDIHDSASSLGAGCTYGGLFQGDGMYEAARMREAALPMNTSHDALWDQLRTAVKTAHGQDQNSWSPDGPYVHDVFPSHVVYSYKGDTLKRPYTSTPGEGGAAGTVKLGDAKKVHVAYVDTKDDSKEAIRIITDVPVSAIERDIPDSVRKKANPEDFAGKGTSFPIFKAEDVDAALRSIGRAGSGNYDGPTLKANILRIAKKKGFAIPDSDKDGESVIITLPAGTEVVNESLQFFDVSKVKESALTTVPIKIIGPGWGSCAYYSTEAIKQAIADKVWSKGQHMYWNHATSAEEAERPEGDLSNLAAVMTRDAYWSDEGLDNKGPGAYTEAKVFSDFGTQVAEKGPHMGASINAAIKAHEGEVGGRKGKIADKIVKAFSTDFVTKAGAGGAPIVPVTESARGQKEIPMDEKAAEALRVENDALKAKVSIMEKANNHVVAVATVGAVLKEAGISFSQSLLERACQNPELTKEGAVTPEWVKAIVADFSQGYEGKVIGVGEAARGTDAAAAKKFEDNLRFLGVPEAGLAFAVKGRV